MTVLMPINRNWFFRKESSFYLDWGEGLAQELLTGAFVLLANDDHRVTLVDADLSFLASQGRVASFDADRVVVRAWKAQ